MESEGVEVQALACSASLCISRDKSCVARSSAGKRSPPTETAGGKVGAALDDASTARTEVSTVVDSYGSLHLSSDGGTTFNSPASSFDGAWVARARSIQADPSMLRIPELNRGISAGQDARDFKETSLMDLDEESDTDHYEGGIKTTLRKKLSLERREAQGGGDHSNITTTDSIAGNNKRWADFYRAPSVASPSSIDWNALETSASRAQFYGGPSSRSNFATPKGTLQARDSHAAAADRSGYPPLSPSSMSGNALGTSERRAQTYGRYHSHTSLHSADIRRDFYGVDRLPGASATSRFADGTLNTDSRVDVYRVECSDSAAEPLSCREKILQPALSCDENFWRSREKEAREKEEKRAREEDWSGSTFSCCFIPTQL